MKKNLIIICNLACLIGFFIGLLGCDQPANETVTPKIVRKKIRSTADKKSSPPQRKPASASRTATKPEPPGPGKQASEKPALAQKSVPPAVKPPESKAPQLPIKPKSDISKIQPSSPKQPAASGAGQATVASASLKVRPTYTLNQVTRREVESKGNLNATTSQKLFLGHLGIINVILIPISFLLRIGLRV